MPARRQLRLILALLLPLMLLRALLPPGYMAVAEQGSLRIVMCSAGLMLPAADAVDADGTNGDHQLPPNAGDCPFAHVAVSAPPIQHVIGVVEVPRVFRFLSVARADLPPATGPPRQSAARAPPRFSAFV